MTAASDSVKTSLCPSQLAVVPQDGVNRPGGRAWQRQRDDLTVEPALAGRVHGPWLVNEYSSIASRLIPHFSAIISAPMN